MSVRPYLPSVKFLTMVGALGLSGGLVLAAQILTNPPPSTVALGPDSGGAAAAQAQQWQAALQEVQAEEGIQAPAPPSPDTVNDLLAAAQSDNLTSTVGRTLLINLSNAKSQGLGDDTPTQDQIIAAAAAQVHASSTPLYTKADLSTVAQTPQSLRQWANAVMATFNRYPGASAQDTYANIGAATDNQSKAALSALGAIGGQYRALAAALAGIPVPETLEPLYLQLVNDLGGMSDTYPDMQRMFDDPLRGLAGVQRYTSLLDETTRVLTSLAGMLNKDGILFTKDEPGEAWSALLPS